MRNDQTSGSEKQKRASFYFFSLPPAKYKHEKIRMVLNFFIYKAKSINGFFLDCLVPKKIHICFISVEKDPRFVVWDEYSGPCVGEISLFRYKLYFETSR